MNTIWVKFLQHISVDLSRLYTTKFIQIDMMRQRENDFLKLGGVKIGSSALWKITFKHLKVRRTRARSSVAEHPVCIREIAGSSPAGSTITDLLHFLPRPRLRLGLRRAENKGNSTAF